MHKGSSDFSYTASERSMCDCMLRLGISLSWFLTPFWDCCLPPWLQAFRASESEMEIVFKLPLGNFGQLIIFLPSSHCVCSRSHRAFLCRCSSGASGRIIKTFGFFIFSQSHLPRNYSKMLTSNITNRIENPRRTLMIETASVILSPAAQAPRSPKAHHTRCTVSAPSSAMAKFAATEEQAVCLRSLTSLKSPLHGYFLLDAAVLFPSLPVFEIQKAKRGGGTEEHWASFSVRSWA